MVSSAIPKISTTIELRLLSRVAEEHRLDSYLRNKSPFRVLYTRKVRYFVQFFDFIPQMYDSKGGVLDPSELKEMFLDSESARDETLALLNSGLFFWFFNVYSDVRNVNRREMEAFRCSIDTFSRTDEIILRQLCSNLMNDFKQNSSLLTNNYGKFGMLTIQTFQPRVSKPIIDEIDRVLARHYGFSEEELDFIINYDIKYRMGREVEDEAVQ